jgi:hypothetical protein
LHTASLLRRKTHYNPGKPGLPVRQSTIQRGGKAPANLQECESKSLLTQSFTAVHKLQGKLYTVKKFMFLFLGWEGNIENSALDESYTPVAKMHK